jgi:hypothetical protein
MTGVVVAVLGTIVFAVTALGAPQPRAIVKESGPIRGFARDGSHIAWAAYHRRAKCFSVVMHRNLGHGRPKSLVSPRGVTCSRKHGFRIPGEIMFAVAGNEALWVLSASDYHPYDSVVHGVVSQPDREIGRYRYSQTFAGDHLTEVAGAGKTLVFGWYRVTVTGDSCNEAENDCRWNVTGGLTQRVDGRRAVPVPGAPGATLVATNGPLVALVKAQGEANRFGIPHNRRHVEVRDAQSGLLISSFRAGRNVLRLALGSRVVAVLLGPPLRIVRRDARTGAVLGSTPVPAETIPIHAAGDRLALASLGDIHVLDLETGRLRQVFDSFRHPIGLSVSEGHVSWAVNAGRRGYVSSLAAR